MSDMQTLTKIDKDFTLLKIRKCYGSVQHCSDVFGVNERTLYAAVSGSRGISNRETISKRIVDRLKKENLLVLDVSTL